MNHKETPETVSAYTGLSIASIRRHVDAVLKDSGSRKKYAKDMSLNGHSVAVYERIAERAKDETIRVMAKARSLALQDNESMQSHMQPVRTELHETSASELHETTDQIALKPVQKSIVRIALDCINSYMLSVINAIDISLIFIGLWRLYALPGIALAIMVSLYFVKAQIIARNADLRQSNYNAIQVVGWMCTTAFVLHTITFWNAMQFTWVAIDGSGAGIARNAVKVFSAIGPAAFVSILAFKAVETEWKISKEKS